MRAPATGVVEAEDEEVLLEAELMPEVSGDHGDVDSQNCGDATISRSPEPRQEPQAGVQTWGLLGVLFRSWGFWAPFVGVERGARKGGAAEGRQEEGGSHLLFLAIGGLGDKAHADLLHVGAGGAGRVHAECVGHVPAAEVGATPELVTGLGVGAAAGTQLRAGGLAAGGRAGLLGGALLGTPPALLLGAECLVGHQFPLAI